MPLQDQGVLSFSMTSSMDEKNLLYLRVYPNKYLVLHCLERKRAYPPLLGAQVKRRRSGETA